MINFKNIKQKILEDDNFATAVEYMLSKVILENPVGQLKFVYKKHKIIKSLKNKFSIYDLKSGKKLYGGIYFQDVAKYIVDNIKCPGRISEILYLEKELFRHRDKIIFFEKYYNQHPSDVLEDKIDSMHIYYERYKNSIINKLKENTVYWK